jgi:hypothetical protein
MEANCNDQLEMNSGANEGKRTVAMLVRSHVYKQQNSNLKKFSERREPIAGFLSYI